MKLLCCARTPKSKWRSASWDIEAPPSQERPNDTGFRAAESRRFSRSIRGDFGSGRHDRLRRCPSRKTTAVNEPRSQGRFFCLLWKILRDSPDRRRGAKMEVRFTRSNMGRDLTFLA